MELSLSSDKVMESTYQLGVSMEARKKVLILYNVEHIVVSYSFPHGRTDLRQPWLFGLIIISLALSFCSWAGVASISKIFRHHEWDWRCTGCVPSCQLQNGREQQKCLVIFFVLQDRITVAGT